MYLNAPSVFTGVPLQQILYSQLSATIFKTYRHELQLLSVETHQHSAVSCLLLRATSMNLLRLSQASWSFPSLHTTLAFSFGSLVSILNVIFKPVSLFLFYILPTVRGRRENLP